MTAPSPTSSTTTSALPREHVGEVNGGWKVLTSALAFERCPVGGGIVLNVAHAFDNCVTRSRQGTITGVRSPMPRSYATAWAEIKVGRQLMMHRADLAADGMTPPEYGAISKVFSGKSPM